MRRVVQKRKRKYVKRRFKEFKFLVLVLVRKSSIVKLKVKCIEVMTVKCIEVMKVKCMLDHSSMDVTINTLGLLPSRAKRAL